MDISASLELENRRDNFEYGNSLLGCHMKELRNPMGVDRDTEQRVGCVLFLLMKER